jgi:hypothetical protein
VSRYPNFSATWVKARYVDLWTLVHLVGGVPFGFVARYLGLGDWSYLAALAIFVLWEVFEIASKIFEAWENRAIDVAVALAGFAAAYELGAGREDLGFLVLVSAAPAIALNVAGWANWFRGEGR